MGRAEDAAYAPGGGSSEISGALPARQLARERDEARQLAAKRAALLDQLQAAERLKADFVASTSHELRTPLTVLTGFAELLLARHRRLQAEAREEFLQGERARLELDLSQGERDRYGRLLVHVWLQGGTHYNLEIRLYRAPLRRLAT